LELALSNTIEAINHKVDFVDCTFTGMGRGAGNLKTELLLSYLGIKLNKIKINNFKNIGPVVDMFEEIRSTEKWGASLPYMISGSTNSPQSQAMQLIKSKRYNMTDIVTYLYKKNEKKDNSVKNLNLKKEEILIIGGGISVKKQINYLKEFLKENKNIFVIFSSSRNIELFDNISLRSMTCITGNEIAKISKNYFKKNKFIINDLIDEKTLLPKNTKNLFKLKKNILSKKINNSPLAISLAAASEINAKKIFLAGFDGFDKIDKVNDYSLFNENQKIFNFYENKLNMIFLSLTNYDVINKSSIFKYLK
jgi:4-hydroxy 2-oxovalerate aldolase